MSYTGHIQNGVVVFDEPVSLPNGTAVKVLQEDELGLCYEGNVLVHCGISTPKSDAQAATIEERVRRLRHAASACGVSLSNEAVSSEGIYE